MNCQHPVDGNPCNQCPSCQAINNQSSLDVLEIDAASNNGVDHIREIREQVQYSPVEGKYKVYIIDEVHMLSSGAFNALLKTLEEPPSYVIFILATTEKHKIPVTILSRCQKYDFKRISIDTITNHLVHLMEKEGIPAEEKALRYIARAADGSMRDALSLLDQCIAFYLNQTLTYDNVLEVLGTVDTAVFSQLLRNILAQDTIAVLHTVDQMITEGRELSQFLADFLWYLRNLLIIKDQNGMEDTLDLSTESIAALQEEASLIETSTLLRFIRVLSDLSVSFGMPPRSGFFWKWDLSACALHRWKQIPEAFWNGYTCWKRKWLRVFRSRQPVREDTVRQAFREPAAWAQLLAREVPLV